ncbi:amino acid adenylation domain-containing protein [Actinopolyspora lacussalsi subsp. righensis]|uniref:Amino acid adenylation domain-containing protein n=1 Tax=Actinopolyspora righensis TaxID=995060 RepID=A0A1I6XDH3_9ACTN|nr:non-ribosomal peptide synthetase [Actinopolyspora righensis]SFT36151.1 amino acid adenylation domain-containing protein [Actinopolyspora righensis]
MVSDSIQGTFAEQVERTPDRVAVSFGDRTLTYRELDKRANQLAHRLLALGVRQEAPVAVLMDRSIELVVALLGVLKAGACYLPLHSAYPLERMQWIINDADRPVLLADTATTDRGLPETDDLVLVDTDAELAAQPVTDPAVPAHPLQLAYVIHTSGSTGHPKGVAVAHSDALGLASDRIWDGGGHERVLMVAPYAFNVSTYEFWVPLLRGGRIVVAPPGDPDVATLQLLISENEVTGVHLTAGLFRVIAEEAPEVLGGVREVLTGGDVIAPGAVRRVLRANPDIVVRCMYGATELTLFSTHEPMTAPHVEDRAIPVGREMDGVRTYILDERLRPVDIGEIGELYVAGRGLARGYYGRPDLTAERFVANPFGKSGERMYRTGDLVRATSDGRVDFVGRVNDQVKINGFRAELGEIEAVLASHPGLAHVAVVTTATATGDNLLVGYVVPETDEFDVEALRAYAAQALPDYMVPNTFLVVDALPLTPNGKLDRESLPKPDFKGGSGGGRPSTERQELLCSLFATVLGIEQVGINDSFFDLGGQSLQGMRLISRVRAALGVDLTITEFFDAPTIGELDAHLEKRAATEGKAG